MGKKWIHVPLEEKRNKKKDLGYVDVQSQEWEWHFVANTI